jgi:hypothetical protein
LIPYLALSLKKAMASAEAGSLAQREQKQRMIVLAKIILIVYSQCCNAIQFRYFPFNVGAFNAT